MARPRSAQGSRGSVSKSGLVDRRHDDSGTGPDATGRFERWFEVEVVQPIADFQDPKQEWRRLFSELLGTFFLVLVAAGGGMMGQAFPNTISRGAAVTAPGLMVMAIILFMGRCPARISHRLLGLRRGAFDRSCDRGWLRVPASRVRRGPQRLRSSPGGSGYRGQTAPQP